MSTKILNFVEKRKETIEQKKRSFERVLFQNFMGSYSVIDGQDTIYPISLVDVSKDGCQFQIPVQGTNGKTYKTDEEVSLRIYFTEHSFIPASVIVKHGKEHQDNNGRKYMRYGCEFDKSMPTFEALESFIEFVYRFAEHSTIDKGRNKVYFI